MAWEIDHKRIVVNRWRRAYIESGMNADDFSNYMQEALLHYGWSEEETKEMIAKAIK